jgi:hypothetical protein
LFAIIAAVLFGLALLLELIDENLGEVLTPGVLTLAGLLFLALHFAAPAPGWGRRSYRGRRPGPG